MLASCFRRRLDLLTPGRRLVSTAANASASTSTRRKRVVFSGIQPTGIPHLGNYLGALSNWKRLQDEAAPEDVLIFSVVGWHALTMPQNPAELRQARASMMAVLLAMGLDPRRSVIFHQDHNPDHTELAWVFNCITPIGKLRRMTTWKSKLVTARNANDETEVDESLLHVGLFDYPVLQAADILAYKATHVPVGEDQQQHLELCRDIADSFNRTFKERSPLFPLPQHVFTPQKRILSLRDSSAKMSKSAPDPKSRILLTDTTSEISKKIAGAQTDSDPSVTYDPVSRPGLANLLTIFAACTETSPEDLARKYDGSSFAKLKKDAAEAVNAFLSGPRAEFAKLKDETGYLDEIARTGAEKARDISGKTMSEVRRRVGLA
ncbi:tryptophanyl-tRNA synthetase [Punctularia strigosozonata HHB-11173 SS5]|uniref:tryptophanyl-tRNA synthetase n=1 Tax=Punctularia strigosozonata (strain HHB-11173) TaxID=741275 RepID=UPI000441746C|nr:tryptophanyl-tRNA synthetase [Punctularia strigosozonata HHB-11173 SS5]EIN07975.1 tryptophanyl-tRNA synthetase [Punctularia strigosozonata HHB-11173 SS5]